MKRFNIDQRGDTIVEVLIAVAVISMVLVSAYAISNRNVALTQDTQEHNQSQQIVQQQIERIRAMNAADPTQLNVAFKCITGSGSSLQPSSDDAACSFDASGQSCSTTEPCYDVVITKDAAGIYTVAATWTRLGGGTSSTKMVYGI